MTNGQDLSAIRDRLDMAETTERVLRLLGLLQQRPVWTGPELAERLGVTPEHPPRRRAAACPRLPGQRNPGRRGWLPAGRGQALPPLLLDDAEAVAVAVSLRMAAGGTVSGASEAALRTLAKLDQVMPPRLRGEVRAIHEATNTLDHGHTVDGEALLRLARACRDTVRVALGTPRPKATPRNDAWSPGGSWRPVAGGT